MPCCNKPFHHGQRPGASRQYRRSVAQAWGLRWLWQCALAASALGLLLLSAVPAVAASTNTPAPVFHSSLKAASAAAAADQSLVLLVFSADWCVPCKQLHAQTLSSPEFKQQGGALHIVDVNVDTETTLAHDYNIEAVPTLVLLTADNKIVARSEGFVQTAELMLWLHQARARVAEGKWEGTAPSSKVGELAERAAADQLNTNDLARLVSLLGDPNPADREAAAKLLLDQREQAVLPLIEAITNSYLAIRIGAAETLHTLAPEALSPDPWQSPTELTNAVLTLRKWWAETGHLPPKRTAPAVDAADATTLTRLLTLLRGNDPVQRTEAMSALVARGSAALPAVREALKQAEKTGDQRTLGLLEDVRWALLVPDEVEEHAGGVRNVLARGKSQERQSATTRLARAGHAAIPALAELLEDADPLVVETAVRTLSGIAGNDSLPAMAALLKASDSNLRMTAAQALGHTHNPAAVKDLLTVLDDPNEVVACTALSALEEVNGERGYSQTKKAQPPEVIQGLKRCLAEPRWRVRAAAAEVTGKLAVKELIHELNVLLDDTDGFVVKSALEALRQLSSAPEPAKLLAVARQHSGLRAEAVELLVNWGSDDAVSAVRDLYQSSPVEGRLALLQGLSGSRGGADGSPWQPVLAQAAQESDPRLRRAVAESLAGQPPKVAAALVTPLLADEDAETRAAAASAVLCVLGGERQITSSAHGSRMVEWVAPDAEDVASSFYLGSARRKATPTNQPPVSAEQLAAWHHTLQQTAASRPDPLTAIALFVTGPTNSGLPELQQAFEHADKAGLERLSHSAAVAALLPRLPWPEAQPIVEKLCASPALFLKMTAYAAKAPTGLSEFLFDPQRFRAAVDPASAEELESSLPRLLEPQQKTWTLVSGTPRANAVAQGLLEATNAAWRAAAVYSLRSQDNSKTQPVLEHALADTNAWVRATAIVSLAKVVQDRPTLERLVAPLAADPDAKVARLALLALLEPETRSAAGLQYDLNYFAFEKVHVWSSSYEPSDAQRPLSTLTGKPPFLEAARKLLTTGTSEESAVAALLLAQYGDWTGLEHLLKAASAESARDDEQEGVLLAAIGLSRDAKYLPEVKKLLAAAKDEQDFRRLLQAVRGMTGPEAREVRLQINKQMRQVSSQ